MLYRNFDTGAVFTLEELKTVYNQVRNEVDDETFEDHLERMLQLGKQNIGGLKEIQHIYTADRETRTFIEECESVEEAEILIALYEREDVLECNYEKDCYCIVDENHCIIDI